LFGNDSLTSIMRVSVSTMSPPRSRILAGNRLLVAALAASMGGYLLATPPVPDLAAQVARADIVQRAGETVWWLGWFGGLHLPSYSAVSPALMAHVGVPATGAAATAASVFAMSRLLRTSLRPRLGAAAFLVTALANLLDGRITFALSLATGLWCLVALTEGNPAVRALLGGCLAVLTCLMSPLGGLFLALAASTLVLVRRRPWRPDLRAFPALHALPASPGLLVLLLLALTMAATVALFPNAGEMPFRAVNFLPAAACTVAVAVCCREPRLRGGAGLYLLAQVCFLFHPTAVGVNITRLAWIFAVPLLVACARLPRRLLVVAALTAALLPAVDLAGQLRASADASARADFYQPLVTALAADQLARPGTLGQRVEVVDSRNHWASAYLARRFTLARGWERQADRAYNPIFYGAAPLGAASYRRWLDGLAVGWVAVPVGPLDYAAVDEAELVATRPEYLVKIWSSESWTLFRVADALPLARPATVQRVDDRAVVIKVGSVKEVQLAIRWSPYLVVTDEAGVRQGCVGNARDWAYVRVPAPGVYTVTADFDGNLRHGPPGCRGVHPEEVTAAAPHPSALRPIPSRR
jgi:hypothetical protein